MLRALHVSDGAHMLAMRVPLDQPRLIFYLRWPAHPLGLGSTAAMVATQQICRLLLGRSGVAPAALHRLLLHDCVAI
eukprot:33012-Eustigmatos_ZCMA.PRE.1